MTVYAKLFNRGCPGISRSSLSPHLDVPQSASQPRQTAIRHLPPRDRAAKMHARAVEFYLKGVPLPILLLPLHLQSPPTTLSPAGQLPLSRSSHGGPVMAAENSRPQDSPGVLGQHRPTLRHGAALPGQGGGGTVLSQHDCQAQRQWGSG